MAEIQIKTKPLLRSDTDQNFQTQNPSLIIVEVWGSTKMVSSFKIR